MNKSEIEGILRSIRNKFDKNTKLFLSNFEKMFKDFVEGFGGGPGRVGTSTTSSSSLIIASAGVLNIKFSKFIFLQDYVIRFVKFRRS